MLFMRAVLAVTVTGCHEERKQRTIKIQINQLHEHIVCPNCKEKLALHLCSVKLINYFMKQCIPVYFTRLHSQRQCARS